MNCIYYIFGVCRAQPLVDGAKIDQFYAPVEEDQKEYCKDKLKFSKCPRLVAYHNHLKARGVAKKR